MANILHRVVIEASPQATYAAVTEQSGLSAWWTRAEAVAEVDSIARFWFGADEGAPKVAMRVTELVPGKKVVWQCIAGPWVETGEFSFDIKPHERGSVLLFAHRGWPEDDEFYMHCNCKWGFFLGVSLKGCLETGEGKPGPLDPDL